MVSIALAAAFCAIEVNRSMSVGALSLPTQYDDSSYYLTGAEYLRTFYSGRIADLVRTYLASPPHAPLSTGLAFLGFLLFGVKAWVGPVVNSALFLLFVRWFFSLTEGIALLQSALLAVALFGFPFVTLTIMTFRPDMFCSLLLACGTLLVVARPQWLTQRRDQVVAGLVLAAALWSKPTVFHLSIALFGAAIFLASLNSVLHGNFRQPARAAFVTLATGILLSIPYYAFAMRHVIDYIWTTVFGSEASIWVRPISLRSHLLFYLTGDYGQMSLGAWLYACMLIGACTLIVLWRDDRRLFGRAILVGAMVVMTYLAVTIPTFKGPHGYPFAAIVFIGTAVASVTLVRRLPVMAGWLACIVLVAFAAWQFAWPTAAVRAGYAESRWSMVRQAFDAVGRDVSGKIFLLTTSAPFLNYNILALEYYGEGLVPPASDNTQTVSDLREQRRRIDLADIVFALTPDFTEVFPHLPTASSDMRAQIIKAIEESDRFKLQSRIPDPVSGGAALIYVRSTETFSHFSKVEGLREEEGPYPQWNMPRVRWGWGSQTRLTAEGEAGTRSKLVLEARTVGLPNQVLTVSINGEVKARASLNDAFAATEATVEFNQQGRAEILLTYSIASNTAALYKTISLQPSKRDR